MSDEARAVPVEPMFLPGDTYRAVPVEGDRERLSDRLNAILIDLDATFDLPFHAALAEAIADRLTDVSLTGSGLDVERLARALAARDNARTEVAMAVSVNERAASTPDQFRRFAQDIAREYAALSGESGEPTYAEDGLNGAIPW